MVLSQTGLQQGHPVGFPQIQMVLPAGDLLSLRVFGRVPPEDPIRGRLPPFGGKDLVNLVSHLITVYADSGADGSIHICRLASEFFCHPPDGHGRDPSQGPPPPRMHQSHGFSHRIRKIDRRAVCSEDRQDHVRQIRNESVHIPSAFRFVLPQDGSQVFQPDRIDIAGMHLVRHALPVDGRAQLPCQPVPACEDRRRGFLRIFCLHDDDPESGSSLPGLFVITAESGGIQIGHAQLIQHLYRQIWKALRMQMENLIVV